MFRHWNYFAAGFFAILQMLRVFHRGSLLRSICVQQRFMNDKRIATGEKEVENLRKTEWSKLDKEHEVEGKQELYIDPYLPKHPGGVNPLTGEIGGPAGPEPTRYGDWERKGRCIDF